MIIFSLNVREFVIRERKKTYQIDEVALLILLISSYGLYSIVGCSRTFEKY